jgi:ABC-type sugar transport system permease subunit
MASFSSSVTSGRSDRRSDRRSWGVGFWNRSKLYLVLMLLMLPALASLAVFTYYPQFGAIKYSFYTWDGENTVEFVGFKNYIEAFLTDSRFWTSFQLVLILLGANIIKMWPSIFAAVVLHRLRSERWQYIYRVLFVVPMIIPSIVSLLVWKSFFDAGNGALNVFLNATGLMHVLNSLDNVMAGLSATAGATWIRDRFVINGLHGLWWMVVLGMVLIVVKMIINMLLYRRRRTADTWVLSGGAALLLIISPVIALFTCVWPSHPIGAFEAGSLGYATPAWLGNEHLVIPSIIFWGFPWVGTVGVLLYLAGLQNISTDVYEAADLDGVGSVRKLFYIELPLILTQVRINLIFLTIGTVTDYGFFLLLLGTDGGPGGKGMVPGLYMYKSAFIEQRFGYACALGMILCVILLFITVIYQRYVKVDK